LPDSLVVSTELGHGTESSCLVEASGYACVLVLQHRDPRHEVAPAQCPVLVVPQTWQSHESPEQPLVLAGVQNASRSGDVVRTALVEADRREARVRLVHGADRTLGGTGERDPMAYAVWLRRTQRELEADFSDLVGSQPGVPVELEVVPEAPATALLTRARGAAVVVMGVGHGQGLSLTRPGPVTTEVLRHSACPVLVIDGHPPRSAPPVERLTEIASP
jgi:nucleotide-binding universal stress UspA family protein